MEENKNKISKTKLTFGLILRASVSDIAKIEEYLSSLEDLRIVYRKVSTDKLYITEEED